MKQGSCRWARSFTAPRTCSPLAGHIAPTLLSVPATALVRMGYFPPRGLLDAAFWISDDSGGNTPRFWLLQGSACTEPGMFLQGLPPPCGVVLSDKSQDIGGKGRCSERWCLCPQMCTAGTEPCEGHPKPRRSGDRAYHIHL